MTVIEGARQPIYHAVRGGFEAMTFSDPLGYYGWEVWRTGRPSEVLERHDGYDNLDEASNAAMRCVARLLRR